MKLFAVHFTSESSDDYYHSFRAIREPSYEQIHAAFAEDFGEEAEYVHIEDVWEVDLKSREIKV